MNNSQNLITWVDTIFNLWKSKNLDIAEGALLDDIEKKEQYLSFKFPEAFKELYKKVNGWNDMAWNEHMFSIWPLDRIIEEYDYMRYPDFIGFSDFLINSHWIGFVRDKPGIFKRYDLQGYTNPEKIADSFEDAIEMINTNADILY
jgi:SMI1 / KNR4 family (SUKH-1)